MLLSVFMPFFNSFLSLFCLSPPFFSMLILIHFEDSTYSKNPSSILPKHTLILAQSYYINIICLYKNARSIGIMS